MKIDLIKTKYLEELNLIAVFCKMIMNSTCMLLVLLITFKER